ncbi:MAG: glycoside hydrolase family 9 protein [Endomicrobia bacterium]|nr:glycoside hydrolase family 9 protein [Endomicrobiia bacterium]
MFIKEILIIFLYFFIFGDKIFSKENPIRINQIGYLPNSKKISFLAIREDFDNNKFFNFYVKDKSQKTVFKGEVKLYNSKDTASGEKIYILDFSELETPGSYYIELEDFKSYDFVISSTVYREVLDLLLLGFYFQRCGEEVKYNEFFHGICHIRDKEAVIFGTNITKDVSGGWHDAGNYEKYVTPTAISCWYLLTTYEVFHKKLPKSIKQRLITEIKHALKWLIKMQDESDGGVHHSVVVKDWSYWPSLPEDHTDLRIIAPKSIFATYNFASIFAKASYVFKNIDKDFSKKCLNKALNAYNWVDNIYKEKFIKHYNKILETDAYEDSNEVDEQLLALCELYKATNNQKYHIKFLETLDKLGYKLSIPSWQDVKMLAIISYLLLEERFVNKEVKDILTQNFESFVKTRASWIDSPRNGYKVALYNSEYYWGSNGILGNISCLFVIFSIIKKNPKFSSYALEQIHYLLGRNSLDKCFVSGCGKNSIKRHHYALSVINKKIYPGFVSGGPNSELSGDKLLDELIYKNIPIAKCFVDDENLDSTSWASNEPCILYNAPWVFVFSYFY